jgi:hypothetical protein
MKNSSEVMRNALETALLEELYVLHSYCFNES